METITLSMNLGYEDSKENLAFWAMSFKPRYTDYPPYKLKLTRNVSEDILDVGGNKTGTRLVKEEYDNPQSVEEYCNEFFKFVIKDILTTPIKKEVNRQVTLQAKSQADALAEQKAQEVISRLTIE